MAKIDDLGITKGKVRAYGHDGAIEKLSVEQIRAVMCDYLMLKWRTQDKWRRWPKDVQRELRARGITQSHTTGMPIVSALGSKMSLRMVNEEKSELIRVSEALEAAEAKLSATGGEVTAIPPKPRKKAPPKPKVKTVKMEGTSVGKTKGVKS